MKAITGFHPDAPPRATFTVVVSTLNIPGHPDEEYTVETHHPQQGWSEPNARMTYIATQHGAEVARHTNLGALLNMLLELET